MWDWLDAAGVPFAVPTATLIAQHGTSVPGPGQDPVCRLPASRVVAHQRDGLTIDTVRLHGPPAPPTALTAHVYDGADGHASFEAAVADLKQQLGPPDAAGALVSSNVRTARWTFGLAQVDLTFWPPELNRSLGLTFAYPDPLRWKASRLEIRPAVMDPFSPAELGTLLGAAAVTGGRVVPPGPYTNAAYWRRRPVGVSDRVAVARGGRTVFVISTRALVIPARDVSELSLSNLTPARGSGGAALRLGLANGGGVSLLDADAPFALDAQAEQLSRALGVPLTASTMPDA